MNLLVVSSYPEKGLTHGKTTVGVASYTKNTLDSLTAADPSIKTTIWSENNGAWRRGSPISLLKLIFKLLFTKEKFDRLLLPHEFNMFGGVVTLPFFPLLLLVAKLKGVKSVLVIHQVIDDFGEIAEHAGIGHSLVRLYNFFLKPYYGLITAFADASVVFDQFLKDRLPNRKKVIVIPHAVETFPEAKDEHPKTFTLLYFGYLAQYKGVDWLIDAFNDYKKAHPEQKLKLIVAGGPNPNHLDKPHYQKFLSEVASAADSEPDITMTGFVDQKDIAKYFNSASCVVLPYRTAMSSSGPLSISLSFNKPFIISKPLKPYLDTADFKKALDMNNLSGDDLVFSLNRESFNGIIDKLSRDRTFIGKLSALSQDLAKKRSWQDLSLEYLKILR